MSKKFEDAIIDSFDKFDVRNFKINYPDHRIFVCGGQIDIREPIPLSFRQRFIEKLATSYPELESEIVLAESFKDYFREHAYRDLLTFEDDIAQLASVVVIFLESPGSLVELGMFCTKPNFYKKLLIVAPREETEREDSFIYLGPLHHIRGKEQSSVAVYPWPSNKALDYPDIHLQDLCISLQGKRNSIPKNPTLNPKNSGHIALLILEIVRLSYPVLLTEIELALASLELDEDKSKVTRLLYLLNKLGYLDTYEYSGYKYYYPIDREKPRVKFGSTKNNIPFDEKKLMMSLKMSYVTELSDDASRKRIAAGEEIQKILKGRQE
ncbi:retron St85 family effector protein [Vibrio parahaemolyticus]|uniref:retron St85 family effector protein n=2 Tax=Vibrio parahaemolyticus TaxID=670 RepID=UPI00186A9074|nr:retron St85 family effector protein [Vibrio parahaemolyticus]ELV8763952.1 retron St85 family effector protein [Vibrio fluvialis]EKD9043212.1 retron St85 family effector protein [Vibrio parahaemolyticus]EKL0190904.1 retron St85 family effector protein [Vibrio parahaemolyticus]ELA7200798.1 retron St85 family effector protein [Vibrio parahaemolyticus]EME0150069.1 retron St85 family effector protein [Vibrio parahaemolyticus]